jgi:hypothetical protein
MKYVLDCCIVLKWFLPDREFDSALRFIDGYNRALQLTNPRDCAA